MQEQEGKSKPLEPGHRGYVAGVIDCDGSIWIATERRHAAPNYTLRVSVTNTRRQLPEWFSEHFGGECRRYPKKSAKWKDEYRWEVSGLNALPVLTLCLPYLVIKRKQALIAMEFASTIIPGQRSIPDSYRELRGELCERMVELNKRGPQ